MFGKKLKGVRVAVLATDGVEQVELTRPVKRLKKEGALVSVISLHGGRIQGVNLLAPGKRIAVDYTLGEVRAANFDALLLPGGFVNPDLLRQNEKARQFVKDFDALARPIAVICHGPWLLVSAGLVHGRRLTSWPGIQDDIKNAGGLWKDEPVVRDGHWVSSRGPHDLPKFEKAMVELFAEKVPEEMRLVVRKKARLWPRLVAGSLAVGASAIVIRARQLSAQT
jgi:protease I